MKSILFVINVDWYYDLHWRERIESSLTSGCDVQLVLTKTCDPFSGGKWPIIDLKIDRASINPYVNGKSFLGALGLVWRQKIDLIHTVTVKPNIYFGILARFFSLPILLAIPGLGTAFSSSGMKYKLLRCLIKAIYGFAGKNGKSYFVFENSTDHQLFLESNLCSSENSKVVAGAGVDLKIFTPKPEPADKNGLVVILFAGRLLHGKGLEDLIQAVALVKQEGHRVRLDVAGITDSSSPEAIPLGLIENWHGAGKINWLGRVLDMPDLLGQVHIVALPSTYGEGLPRILLEANACGRPVITSNIPGGKDLVQHGVNGLLVDPGAVEQLASTIKVLLNRDKRQQMGLAGRKIVVGNYSQEKVIEQYKKIYKTLLKEL